MTTRKEHLDWCKSRAREYVEQGDLSGAVASMMSDLGKWEKPLYDSALLSTVLMDGMAFRKTQKDMTNWIDGFN